jgi:hypothetical protein
MEIAKMEKRTCELIQTAYIDELEPLYKDNFNYIFDKLLIHLESGKSCLQLIETLRIA